MPRERHPPGTDGPHVDLMWKAWTLARRLRPDEDVSLAFLAEELGASVEDLRSALSMAEADHLGSLGWRRGVEVFTAWRER